MSNILIEPKPEGSISDINESSSMTEKLSIEIETSEDKVPRKYGLSWFFQHFVCCSCFTTEHDNVKYKSNTGDNVNAPKTVLYDVNGKQQKFDDFKNLQKNSNDETYEKIHDHDVAICSPLAQNISASNGSERCFQELNDSDSQDSLNSNRTTKINSENESLLPEITEKCKNKKCFIIDLDETLVHSSFKFVKTADIKVNVEIDGTEHKVFVCKRPYADQFLAELGDLFECVLFTASLGKYADPVTDYLDPTGIFEARLFREACAFRDGNYVKDLDAMGRNIDDILILDNSPVSYLLHPRNAVQIVSWFDDPADTALRDLIPYFKDLAASPLSVPEWLERNRPPETAGILGYPSTNLHWILMQTLSVPEALTIYKQHHRESSHYPSGSSNVSRQSSRKGCKSGPQVTTIPQMPHHSLITQAINISQRQSVVCPPDHSDDDRPPVSSPVARPSSAICLDDDINDVEAEYSLSVTYQDQQILCQLSSSEDSKFVSHSNDQIKSRDASSVVVE